MYVLLSYYTLFFLRSLSSVLLLPGGAWACAAHNKWWWGSHALAQHTPTNNPHNDNAIENNSEKTQTETLISNHG